MKTTFLLYGLFAVTSLLSAQGINTGMAFLKTAADARSVGMGEAFTAMTNDHSSFFYNPAAIRSSDRRQLRLNHRQGMAEMMTDYIGATIPTPKLHFAVSAYSTSVNDIEVRLRPGDPEGTFGARNGALSAGVAADIGEGLTIGVAGKLLYEKIYIDEAGGYGIDAGIHYTVNPELSFGGSISNLGSMSVLRSVKTPLPTTIRAGGAVHSPLADDWRMTAAADLVKTVDDDLLHAHLGAEITYDGLLLFRTGYQTGYEIKSLSTGIGVRYGLFQLDYAFVPMTGAFGAAHSFSLLFLL